MNLIKNPETKAYSKPEPNIECLKKRIEVLWYEKASEDSSRQSLSPKEIVPSDENSALVAERQPVIESSEIFFT